MGNERGGNSAKRGPVVSEQKSQTQFLVTTGKKEGGRGGLLSCGRSNV